MIHLGRRSYPYMEEVNEGILQEFRRLLPTTGRALDVGCGRGQLGQAIKELGWRVWGIEENEEARAIAAQRLDRAIRSDLTQYDAVARELDDGPFDAIVFSDVLEHLYDPRTVVERYLEWLAPGGRVFVSVPNAVVWSNRLRWAMGRVEYEDTGVMDRTHIRFFTFDSAKELLQACGCEVTHVSSTPYIVRAILPLLKTFSKKGEEKHDPRAIIDSPAYKAYMRFAYPVESTVSALWPTMLAFRIVVVAEFAGGA